MAKNNFGKIINLIAFAGLILVAVVLILQKINITGSLTAAFGMIGESIAYLITAISAFFYVNSKRNVWWYVVYAVAVVLVVIFMVIR